MKNIFEAMKIKMHSVILKEYGFSFLLAVKDVQSKPSNCKTAS